MATDGSTPRRGADVALDIEEEFEAVFKMVQKLVIDHPEEERDLKDRYGIPFVESDGSVTFPDEYRELCYGDACDLNTAAVAKLLGVDPDTFENAHRYWTTSGCYGAEWNDSGCTDF